MTRAPAFQLYVNDWLSSTKICTMTPSEEGAYIRLLCHAWNGADCSLPDDDAVLAVLSRLGEDWHKGAGSTLRQCFTPHPRKPGALCNVRLLAEFKLLQKFRRDKQRAGKLGGVKSGVSRRHLKEKEVDRHTKHTFVSASSKTQAKRTSSSSSSSSILKKDTWATFAAFWEAYPRKKHKGKAEERWATLKPDAALVATMLSKIAEAKHTPEWLNENGHWIPYPATWLKAKGWLDEFPAPRKERLPL
jgi:uncharacterized protein YdaU (DUF1376 family)